MTTTGPALRDALDTANDPSFRTILQGIEIWLAEATGQPFPEPHDDHNTSTDDQSLLAWQDSADLSHAINNRDPARAAGIAAAAMSRLLAAVGIDDDFCVLWPPLLLAALAAHDVDLAERLLRPVDDAPPGRVSPAVAAHWHRFRGLLAAARGDDPTLAEAEMRTGIAALAAFGANGYRAQAQEELARWLVQQQRSEDAAPLVDAARTTYSDIGATGWLARLEAWDTSRTRASAR